MATTLQNERQKPPRSPLYGAVAQLGERLFCTQRVGSSNLPSSKFYEYATAAETIKCPRSSVGQSGYLVSSGSRVRIYAGGSIAPVTQRLEYAPFKRRVGGSNPLGSTNFKYGLVAQRTERSVSTGSVEGSTPSKAPICSLGLSAGPLAYIQERTVQLSQGVVGLLAQWTEQCASNARVKGSNPLRASKFALLAQWTARAATNREVGGSNPSQSVMYSGRGDMRFPVKKDDVGSRPTCTANSLRRNNSVYRIAASLHPVVIRERRVRFSLGRPMEVIRPDEGHALKACGCKSLAGASPCRFRQFRPCTLIGKAPILKISGLGVRSPRWVPCSTMPMQSNSPQKTVDEVASTSWSTMPDYAIGERLALEAGVWEFDSPVRYHCVPSLIGKTVGSKPIVGGSLPPGRAILSSSSSQDPPLSRAGRGCESRRECHF